MDFLNESWFQTLFPFFILIIFIIGIYRPIKRPPPPPTDEEVIGRAVKTILRKAGK